jgi:1,4-alpha-glucan branching enzyme
VLEEAARQGLALAPLDEALARHPPAPAPPDGLPTTTWGTPRDLSTWDGPPVAELAWRARDAELRALAGHATCLPSPRALRELALLQSSDWAFQITRELAGDYPHERAVGHLAALEALLA